LDPSISLLCSHLPCQLSGYRTEQTRRAFLWRSASAYWASISNIGCPSSPDWPRRTSSTCGRRASSETCGGMRRRPLYVRLSHATGPGFKPSPVESSAFHDFAGTYRFGLPWPPGELGGTRSGLTRRPSLVSPYARGSFGTAGRPVGRPSTGAAPVVVLGLASGRSAFAGALPPC
jgi:hypothetical protein